MRVNGFGAPGEMLSLTCSVVAAQSCAAIQVSVSDLLSPAGVIDARSIQLYVVKVWEQAGLGAYQSPAMRVPELLLKDDGHALSDGYTRTQCTHHWKHLLRPARFYSPPDVRLDGNVQTSLTPNQPKQLWLSVKIPLSTVPGSYAGHIEARSLDKAFPTQRIELHLDVLPIHLLEPEQDLFIWYKGTLDCRFKQHYLPTTVFRAQLQDIYDHGFRSLSLNESDPKRLQQAVDIAQSIGFNRNVLLSIPRPATFQNVDFKGMTPIYYISDEIDVHDSTFVRSHVENWREAHKAHALTMCSLVHQSFARRLFDNQDIGHAPDVLSYYLPQNPGYFLAHSAFAALRDRKTYYYWLSHMEKPNLHRVLAGVYLWKSKADGIAPYCYQHLPHWPFSPFDDFDEWEPDFHLGDERRPFKDHMTTYPARAGSIPTIQWKGISAGIYDLRYLTTIHALLRSIEHSGAERATRLVHEVRQRLESFLQRVSLRSINIMSESNPEPYQELGPMHFSNFRAQLARDIMRLQMEQ